MIRRLCAVPPEVAVKSCSFFRGHCDVESSASFATSASLPATGPECWRVNLDVTRSCTVTRLTACECTIRRSTVVVASMAVEDDARARPFLAKHGGAQNLRARTGSRSDSRQTTRPASDEVERGVKDDETRTIKGDSRRRRQFSLLTQISLLLPLPHCIHFAVRCSFCGLG